MQRVKSIGKLKSSRLAEHYHATHVNIWLKNNRIASSFTLFSFPGNILGVLNLLERWRKETEVLVLRRY